MRCVPTLLALSLTIVMRDGLDADGISYTNVDFRDKTGQILRLSRLFRTCHAYSPIKRLNQNPIQQCSKKKINGHCTGNLEGDGDNVNCRIQTKI